MFLSEWNRVCHSLRYIYIDIYRYGEWNFDVLHRYMKRCSLDDRDSRLEVSWWDTQICFLKTLLFHAEIYQEWTKHFVFVLLRFSSMMEWWSRFYINIMHLHMHRLFTFTSSEPTRIRSRFWRTKENTMLKSSKSYMFDMDVSKNSGFPPKSSILIGFSIINHPF